MLKISKKGDYGTIFLTNLAQHQKTAYVSLRAVADETNIPYKFLSQIALELKNAGLVESKEGTTGGYKLAKNPQDITLRDILVSLEGPVTPVTCLKAEIKGCRCAAACRHKPLMSQLAQTIDAAMSKHTLAELIA